MLILAALGGFGLAAFYFRTAPDEWAGVRQSPLWHDLLTDSRPLTIVVGDYYLFGESDASMEIRRLIREFSINSKSDLDNFRAENPQRADQYIDLGMQYLPTSTAFALQNLIPVITEPRLGQRRRINLVLMSKLTSELIKHSDLLYVGYLSGLGPLQSLVFKGSRFSIGDSFDELLDTKAGRRYVSQTESQSLLPDNPSYKDFGLFAHFRGPSGNIVVVVSGTRDEGVRQTAELFTDPVKLKDLEKRAALPSYEALVEVSAMNGLNMNGRVIVDGSR